MAERSKIDKAISSLVSEMSHYVYPLKENYVVFKSRLLAHFTTYLFWEAFNDARTAP